MALGDTRLEGVDQFFNSAGTQLAPLGFGVSVDWEIIERRRNISAVSTADFFWDDDTYDEVEIAVRGIIPGTDDRDLLMQWSTDGSTFITTSTYRYTGGNWNSNGGAADNGNNSTTSILLVPALGTTAGESADVDIRITNVSSTREKYCTHHWVGRIADTFLNHATFAGANTTTSRLRGFRLLGELSATLSIDEVIVRGRRRSPASFISQDDWVVIDDQTGISAVTTHDVFWDDQVWDEIEITVHGLTVNTDNIDVDLLLSTDGSTFHNAAGNYKWSAQHSNGTPTAAVIGSNSDTRIRLLPFNGTGTDEHYQSKLVINNVANTTRKKTADYTFSGLDSGGLMQRGIGAGILMANNNSIRGFRLDPASTATMSADRIRVRGRRITPIGVLKQDWEVIKVVDIADTGSLATIEFTDIPSPEFDEFELSIMNADSDTTAQQTVVQFSANNGSSYDTGNNYMYAMHRQNSEAVYNQDRVTAASGILITQNFGSTSVRLGHGSWRISSLDSGSRKHVWGTGETLNDSGNERTLIGGGFWFGTGSDGVITAFRLSLVAGGNWTGGRFILRGRRKV